MKIIAVLLICTCFSFEALPAGDVPDVVLAGLSSYRTNGLKAAYETWSKGTLESDKQSREAAISGLSHVESAYGKMVGSDILKTVSIGSAVKRVYLVLLYEKGPVYAYIECYKLPERWTVTDLMFHTKANAVFPAGLLGG